MSYVVLAVKLHWWFQSSYSPSELLRLIVIIVIKSYQRIHSINHPENSMTITLKKRIIEIRTLFSNVLNIKYRPLLLEFVIKILIAFECCFRKLEPVIECFFRWRQHMFISRRLNCTEAIPTAHVSLAHFEQAVASTRNVKYWDFLCNFFCDWIFIISLIIVQIA